MCLFLIFEDNLEGEQNGEFPSQWDLIDGYVENALFEGENVIGSIDGSLETGSKRSEGIFHARIINCEIGNHVKISHVIFVIIHIDHH